MASIHILLFASLLFFTFPTNAQTSFRPKALVLQVSKDPCTLQYLTTINQRTPLLPVKLTLDLGGRFLWVDCEDKYVSSTYKTVSCGSAECTLAKFKTCGYCDAPPTPGCRGKACVLSPENTVTFSSTFDFLSQDLISIQSTNGRNPGRFVSVSSFLFTCSESFLLEGLARGVKGMAGLGRNVLSLPSLFSSAFSFKRKFAICLSSNNGAVFFGDGPYVMLPGIDVSQSLIYTPLILNPVSTASSYFLGEPSTDYFIGVKSIRINGKTVPLNTSLLAIDKKGHGGTKISTVNPYTVMQTSIYKAVVGLFTNEISNVPKVASIKPFGACFNSTYIGSTRVGPAVPQIDLVLQTSEVYWTISGANSMVQVKNDVLCLGFVDGGLYQRTSIVIGGYQLEDNLLQIDLATSRLGFSSSLLFRKTTCSNFNFTSHA